VRLVAGILQAVQHLQRVRADIGPGHGMSRTGDNVGCAVGRDRSCFAHVCCL
jgi:hypothetical protein